MGQDQDYSVRSGYSLLDNIGICPDIDVFQQLLNLKVAPTAHLCVWRAILDRLPRVINLRERKSLIHYL